MSDRDDKSVGETNLVGEQFLAVADMDIPESKNHEGKGKKGKSGEAAAAGRGRPQASDAFLATMKTFGFSMAEINKVLLSWIKLDGQALAARLSDFFKERASASKHMVVQFSNGGFDLVASFLNSESRPDAALMAIQRHDLPMPSPK